MEGKNVNIRISAVVCLIAGIASAQEVIDERPRINATGYFGIALDSFAAAELNKYINPDQDGKIKERAIGGVTFGLRLLGDPNANLESTTSTEKKPWIKRTQLWVYGETVHGARSAGVDCTADDPPTGSKGVGVCVQFDPTKPDRTLSLIRNSTSLEAFAGLRWEFKQLNEVSLYAKAQAGYITVAGVGGDVVDSHHGAFGLIATAGTFKESYFEVGLGKTDLFPKYQAPRLKIDGYLQFPLLGTWAESHGLTGFAQMTVDSNWRPGGADSIQSYFGINFDLRRLF
jgi:hypothetical protein